MKFNKMINYNYSVNFWPWSTTSSSITVSDSVCCWVTNVSNFRKISGFPCWNTTRTGTSRPPSVIGEMWYEVSFTCPQIVPPRRRKKQKSWKLPRYVVNGHWHQASNRTKGIFIRIWVTLQRRIFIVCWNDNGCT